MDKQQNLLPTLCYLCGMKATRNLRKFNYNTVMTRLEAMYQLYKAGGGSGFSPLHLACQGRTSTRFDKDFHINLVDGLFLSVNFVLDDVNVIVLPRTAAARHIARLWAYIVRYAMAKEGLAAAENRFAYILVNPAKLNPAQTVIGEIDLTDVSPEVLRSTYEAFVTSALTHDETDFDIEIELQGMRDRSAASRQRIKSRMQKMGLRVLKGSKASIYLHKSPGKCTVDLKRLATDFPQAYAACVKGARQYEYITIKLNKNND